MHEYDVGLAWEGDRGAGTSDYTSYDRRFRVTIAGKPDLVGTADPAFRGEPALHNPEELFVAAIAACHMLFYLSLCARAGVVVRRYADAAAGRLSVETGRFESITLRPRVTIAGGDPAVALALHARAGALCFLARSTSIRIDHDARVEVGAP